MKRYESESDKLKEAWVEVPEDWTSGDYDTYIRAYAEAQAQEHSHPLCRLAGVLALILKERVNVEVSGLDLKGEIPSLDGFKAEAMAFLIDTVAASLELTQIVPFGLSEPSKNGTKAKKTDE